MEANHKRENDRRKHFIMNDVILIYDAYYFLLYLNVFTSGQNLHNIINTFRKFCPDVKNIQTLEKYEAS